MKKKTVKWFYFIVGSSFCNFIFKFWLVSLSPEVQKQNVLSHTAQDSQALWEEELKSRSKLGLRLAELEKEKGELTTQVIT